MIYTSYYARKDLPTKDFLVGISIGRNKYKKVDYYSDPIAPTWDIVKIKNEAEYRKPYIELLYSRKDLIEKELDYFLSKKTDTILLCYEKLEPLKNFCHRTIFSEWVNENFNIQIDEYRAKQTNEFF
ncbi:MAG: hypothetical protein ACRCZB_05520 [Bacteroidales bacterium]